MEILSIHRLWYHGNIAIYQTVTRRIINFRYQMEKRKCPDFGKKYFIQNILLFIPLALLLWLAWSHFEEKNVLFWVSTTFFVSCVIGGLIWDRRRINRFYCPQCNRLVAQPSISSRKEGDPINYTCTICNIEWETGLREGGIN